MKIAKDSLIVTGAVLALVAAAMTAVYLPQSHKLTAIRADGHGADVAGLRTQELREAARPGQAGRPDAGPLQEHGPAPAQTAGARRVSQGDSGLDLAEAKLVNQSIEPGSPQREQLYHTLPIVMKFQGSYLSLAAFLKRIQDMDA